MLVYNVTTKVSSAIHHDWLAWMQKIHIPAVMQTGCFTEYKILRLLDIDDSEGPTYAIDKWGQQIIGFRSLMAVVN
ncbi:MAG: hypothetical protein RL596_2691 [Bacteroidota bacterium]